MIVIFHEKETEIASVFGSHPANIPFLASTILETSIGLWKSIASSLNEEAIFYFPYSWQEFVEGEFYHNIDEALNLKEKTLIVLSSQVELPIFGLSTDDVRLAKEKKNLLLGNITYTDKFPCGIARERTDFETVEVVLDNYLSLSSSFLEDAKGMPSDYTYGNPIIVGTVENSTICGPCYISEDSTITDSTIFPGSIIISSHVFNSEVFGSLIEGSKVAASQIRHSIVARATAEKVNITDSIVPRGAIIRGKTPQV